MSYDYDDECKKRRRRKKHCKKTDEVQQSNAQAQACSSQMEQGFGNFTGADSLGALSGQLRLALAKAALEKKVRVHTKADDGSNAQGQGQICQTDTSALQAIATNVEE